MRRKISASWKFALAVAAAFPVVANCSTQLDAQAVAQQEKSTKTSRLDRFSHDVKFMASDELGGRDTYSPGAEKTIEYIVDEFKKYGIKSAVPDGSYRQPFEVNMGTSLDANTSNMVVTAGDKQMALKLKQGFMPQRIGGSGKVTGDLVFVGYGISDERNGFDEYNGVDVKGKVVVMIRRQPKLAEGQFSEDKPARSAFIRNKIRAAKRAGAAGIVFVNDLQTNANPADDSVGNDKVFGQRSMGIPFVHVSQTAFNQLLAASPVKAGDQKLTSLEAVTKAINKSGKPLSQKMDASVSFRIDFVAKKGWGYNVCGVIEGEGPLAHQTVVVGGHYDHLGNGSFGSRTPDRFGEVHNGADDNATGTAAVLELARRFAESGKKPSRRIVFIAFSGEERGLLGSRFYCEKPIYPLESTVAMINFDMIGWLRKDRLTLYGTGTAAAWETCAEKANADTKMVLNNINSPFAGSDHMPFFQKNVACVFVHTGLTPTYHTPDDDYATLDMKGASRVVDFTEQLIIQVNETKDFKFQSPSPRRARRSRAYLGAQLDFENVKDNGLVVVQCSEGSPAEQAGLKKGDILNKIDGKAVRSRPDISKFLRGKKPSDKIYLEVIRGDKTEKIMVILGKR